MTHLENLEKSVGSLHGKKILDVGSGRGEFLLECVQRGYHAVGLELNREKIAKAQQSAQQKGLELKIIQGQGEHMPFENSSFDFANVCEVIEHVRDPQEVLVELNRVLSPGGSAYISVHNRYGFYDTHFHVYFLGWMPRFLANFYLRLLRKHKDYEASVDLQNIKEMHYFTYSNFEKVAKKLGFQVVDARKSKIKRRFSGPVRFVLLLIYGVVFTRFYFSTFHLFLVKHEK